MEKTILLFCLLAFTSSKLYSQKSKNDSPLTISSGYIQVDGGKLFYENTGKGDCIVLLHDGLLHREVWDAQFLVLAKNYRVVRYDRRGYGKSSNPQAPYSNIDDLNQLFTQLQIEKAILFGMSAGGDLVLNFTLKYPEKVTALVLVGAVVDGYSFSDHTFTRGGRLESLTELFADPQKMIRYFGWEDPYEIYPENVKAKQKCLKLLEANPINVDRKKHTFAKPADRLAANYLSEIKVPTLVLVGENDIPDAHAHSGVIEFGIPNARREIILKSGHLIPLDQPEIFNASVLKFLSSLQ